MRRSRDPITDLRRAIDALPVTTREAMLDGIRSNPIVVGAYTDDRGGICPMLAAHRNGGRTTHLAFARSWDAFAGSRRVRRATRRELAILEFQLTASLLASEHWDLEGAIADHEAIKRRTSAAPVPVHEPVPVPVPVPVHEPGPVPGLFPGRTRPDITAERLGPDRIARLRPRRHAAAAAAAERALARLDQHALAANAPRDPQ